jgi:hypothetical protein
MAHLQCFLRVAAVFSVASSLSAGPRFADNADGTVTDMKTGLIWQKEPPSQPYTHAEATEYCDGLNLAGYGDWRLPEVGELLSIMEFDRRDPSLDPIFEARPDQFYWSSSIFTKDTGLYWTVHFGSGTDPEPSREERQVRAVRGPGLPSNRLIDNGDGTITDESTGLMWQQNPPAATMSFTAARTYCDDLAIAGHSDWRLPDIRELLTINAFERFHPSIDPLFVTAWNWYWSSTLYTEENSFVWQIYFAESDVNPAQASSSAQVRAVRTATSAAGFDRKDPNDDGAGDISDAIFTLAYLFLGTETATCQKAADTNDDGAVDVSDAIFLLGYLFLGGISPTEPLGTCGMDPTPDRLTCENFGACR